MNHPQRKVLLVGWDAADWALLRPLAEQGRLPHLAALMKRGCRGKLASLRPILSPIVWTSLATGHRPHKHGVLGFVEPDPLGSGVRLVGRSAWRKRPFWDILGDHGLKTQITGWFATDPARAAEGGVLVSDRFAAPAGEGFSPVGDTVSPAALAETLADLRVHPSELDASVLQWFVPELSSPAFAPGPADTALLGSLAHTLAETLTHHAVATHLMETQPWDCAAVYFRLLDECGHHFMPFRPPAAPGLDPVAARRYGGVIDAACVWLDGMLGRLVQLAGPDATVILVSDHGFQSGPQRPAGPANQFDRMAQWHRPFGLVLLAGPDLVEG
jgi:predicted AlkP superfamily phosphohydrolase/phosphomutase